MPLQKPSLRWAALLSATLCIQTTHAWAAKHDAKSREREARKACLNGDFAKGVAILSDLFVESRDAGFLYNQGRCFEQNRRYEEAIARFQEYLRVKANADPSDRAETERHIADCEALLAKKVMPPPTASGQPLLTPPSPQPAQKTEPAAAQVVPAALPSLRQEAPPVSRPAVGYLTTPPPMPRQHRWVPWTMIGVGAAAAVFGIVAISENGKISSTSMTDSGGRQEKYSSLALGAASATVGGLLLISGTTWLVIQARRSSTSVSLSPRQVALSVRF